jgi:hypothetical protein
LVRVDLTCSACFALLSGSTPSRRAWLLDSPSWCWYVAVISAYDSSSVQFLL